MSTVDLGSLVSDRAKLEKNLAEKIGLLEAEQKKTKELQAQVRELGVLADRVDAADEAAQAAKQNAGKWRHERDKLTATLTKEQNALAVAEQALTEQQTKTETLTGQLAEVKAELVELRQTHETLAKLQTAEASDLLRLRELEQAVIAYRVALKGLVGADS